MSIATYQVRWCLNRWPVKDRAAAAAEYRTLPKLLEVADADLASLNDDEGLWDVLKKKTGCGWDAPRFWRGNCFYRVWNKNA